MRDPNAATFREFPYGSTPGCFLPNYIPDRRLVRSARFRTGRLLLSAKVEASDERYSTRRLDFFFARLPINAWHSSMTFGFRFISHLGGHPSDSRIHAASI